ncbi:MAG: hypothetical protein A2946_03140 [Candidatus Liptonbacteria bacterium RIFCSPLOWO2_01_FULL_53_13]|uniref:PD(D/E)XK endonuclease domain-containing protein n=1 Tax=Candidatus Liptonbacteria bacterium RIFCSPLOWO2_01_FULL_53_13 TaxID=1798651 RepID=A0A1G2CMJ1_9BACT|nr:MAG: hypothetical protein A2946_03140 [Candidatus Liptonbacteria bacterium RIFCSPLOWO2_01_FULL_53_13]
MNTKERGDVAVGHAIAHYLENGYEGCLPIGDKRHYDFLIERAGTIKRVQVKYAGVYGKHKKCVVGLRITGGNQSYSYARKYSDEAFDELFVYTEKAKKFVIPWKEVDCRNELAIEAGKYRQYMVE